MTRACLTCWLRLIRHGVCLGTGTPTRVRLTPLPLQSRLSYDASFLSRPRPSWEAPSSQTRVVQCLTQAHVTEIHNIARERHRAGERLAHSGLGPAHEISGTSVRKQSRISRAGNRHLPRAPYMPALVSARCDPYMKGFLEALLARHKNTASLLGRAQTSPCKFTESCEKRPYDGCKVFPAASIQL
jgi:hypothetical protein